jgi:hypothetical protein
MLRFFNPVPPQDVEMAGASTHTTSSSVPIAPHNETVLDPNNAPEIFAFIEKQKTTIETFMRQVSHHILMNKEDTIYIKNS